MTLRNCTHEGGLHYTHLDKSGHMIYECDHCMKLYRDTDHWNTIHKEMELKELKGLSALPEVIKANEKRAKKLKTDNQNWKPKWVLPRSLP